MMKKAVILMNELSDSPTPDELDVLDQACAVEEALEELEIESNRMFMDLNLRDCSRALKVLSPGIIFNLVENTGGRADLIWVAPAFLKSTGIPFTGCSPESILLTSNKLLAKKILKSAGIPTPEWYEAGRAVPARAGKKFIIKPLWEDASVGITDRSIFNGTDPEILNDFAAKFGREYFTEEYIAGREFNISLLSGENGPEVLSPAEMTFTGFPAGKPLIVGYAAKWDESSFEFENTRRTFDLPASDASLTTLLKKISLECWELFNLSGYARVDFRVDEEGRPWVLEVNANPCISPGSGFNAACERSGVSFTACIGRIMDQALKDQNGYNLPE